MTVSFRLVPTRPTWHPRSAQPTAVDPMRLLEVRTRAELAIERIDRALGTRSVCACVVCGAGLPRPAVTCLRCTRTEHRSAPPDERPVGVPLEYAAGGRILEVR
jgi:hypothetical protein